jgi:hypothetical protein
MLVNLAVIVLQAHCPTVYLLSLICLCDEDALCGGRPIPRDCFFDCCFLVESRDSSIGVSHEEGRTMVYVVF